MRGRFAIAALLCFFVPVAAYGAPKKGFSVFGGTISSSDETTFDDPRVGTLTGTGSGLSIGIDYQIVLGSRFSLNPFVESSGETGSGDWANDVSLSHGIFGIQARLWFGAVFLEAHVGTYSTVASRTVTVGGQSTTVSESGAGGGSGFGLGWEATDSGLYLAAQTDSASFAFTDGNDKLTQTRLHIGYRWK